MTGRILVVDDEPDVRRSLGWRLKAQGFVITEAGSVDEGIAAVQAEAPDLIIVDYRLPGRNAPEFAAFLDAEPALASIPLILISASTTELPRKAAECRADAWLGKPIEPEALLAVVRKYCPQQ